MALVSNILLVNSAIFVFCSVLHSGFASERRQFDVDVKPSGSKETNTEEWDGFKCTFSYTCFGGTNENWKLTIERSNDLSQYKCSVERSGGSYLFFQEFRMTVPSVIIDKENVNLESSPGEKLRSGEYTIDTEESFVEQDDEFQSKLCKVEVSGSGGRDEL